MFNKVSTQWVFIVSLLALSACGGGGGGGTTPTSYTVTASAGANGSISPTSVSVNSGDTTSFTVTPDMDYQVDTISGCNGSLSGNTYTTGAISSDCAVTVSFVKLLPTVSALFPTNGSDWNDYVVGSNWAQATDTACTAVSDTACLHGGEYRVVDVPYAADCTGLTAVDSLGAFNWMCDMSTGSPRFISTGLADGKYLSDLIDFTAPGFLGNAVTVYQGSSVLAATPSTNWWNNTMSISNAAINMNIGSNIYLITTPVTTTATYNFFADKVALVIQPGVTISRSNGVNTPIIYGSGYNYLWVEGNINAYTQGSGVRLASTKFSVLRNVGVAKPSAGFGWDTGVLLDTSSHNRLTDIITSGSNWNGVRLVGSTNNTLTNINAGNNTLYGIYLDGSVNNRIGGAVLTNNSNGLRAVNASESNTLLGVTANNNSSSGIFLADTSGNNTFSSAAIGNNIAGTHLVTDNNHYADVVAANNTTGILLDTASNNSFSGMLMVGNNSTADCTVTAGTNPGLVDGTCANNGASNATLTTGITLANTFVGKVTSDDVANADDNSGTFSSLISSTFDWTHFDNPRRSWGKDGLAFPDINQRGKWFSGTGRIWDWSLSTGDTGNGGSPAALNVLALPTGNDTLTHIWSGAPATNDNAGCDALVTGATWNGAACQTTFLRAATEIHNDGYGNDNTLCESGETCLYMPNAGSYQGHGDLVSAGAFTNGALTGITLMKYSINGR